MTLVEKKVPHPRSTERKGSGGQGTEPRPLHLCADRKTEDYKQAGKGRVCPSMRQLDRQQHYPASHRPEMSGIAVKQQTAASLPPVSLPHLTSTLPSSTPFS